VTLTDEVRATCAEIAAQAHPVGIDLDAVAEVQPAAVAELDPERHYLEGDPADVADYMLALDAINFGSGWFPTLRKRTFEGAPDLVAVAGDSAERLAEMLARGMAMFDDRGFYKRAQIVPNDLALAGVAEFGDLDRLAIFADNLVPHVLRCDGVLVYDDELAARIDGGVSLEIGGAEREIRACAVHACELISQRTGVPARTIDTWLWTRGQAPEYKAHPRHRCRTVFY
jgi:hypothetical protein